MTLRWFLWPVAGALAALTFLAILSIGIFIAPLAFLALLAATRWGGDGVAEGLITGAGITLVGIGLINLRYTYAWLAIGCAFLMVGIGKRAIGDT